MVVRGDCGTTSNFLERRETPVDDILCPRISTDVGPNWHVLTHKVVIMVFLTHLETLEMFVGVFRKDKYVVYIVSTEGKVSKDAIHQTVKNSP